MHAASSRPDLLLAPASGGMTSFISIQPASPPPPVASHKGALGALVVNLYPHGTCWSP